MEVNTNCVCEGAEINEEDQRQMQHPATLNLPTGETGSVLHRSKPGYLTANLNTYKYVIAFRNEIKKNPPDAEKI
jgi:hypothetical protein